MTATKEQDAPDVNWLLSFKRGPYTIVLLLTAEKDAMVSRFIGEAAHMSVAVKVVEDALAINNVTPLGTSSIFVFGGLTKEACSELCDLAEDAGPSAVFGYLASDAGKRWWKDNFRGKDNFGSEPLRERA